MVLPKLGGDSAYLVNESVTVSGNGALRVEAGTRIYFGQSAYLRVDGGNLLFDGQPNDSIYLLCYEMSHDWSGVQLKNIQEEDSVRLSYVKVVGALTALTASNCEHVTVDHCLFNNYYAGKGIEMVDCSHCLVDSCFFSQCVSGIELKARTMDCENNRFSHSIFDQGQINIEISNVGYGFKCNNNVVSDNCFQGAVTAISFEAIGGISDKEATNYIENNLISSKLPEGGSGYSSYGIKAATDSIVIRNNIFWKNDEAIRMMRVCQLYFEHNTFYDNEAELSNLLSAGSAVFVGNTFSEDKKRIATFPSDKSRLNSNNFLHYPKDFYLFANNSPDDIDMRSNYWDTELEEEIESVLFDHHLSPNLGAIVYEKFLHECDTTAPVSPPFMVKKQYVNGSWLISWDENPERDLDHYVLFYGNFDYYKFANAIDNIRTNSYTLSLQQTENVAVMACDRDYNPDVYAAVGQSAYAFATYYPYAGSDGNLCAPQTGFTISDANIPYTYNGFVWRTSGTGTFSDSLSLRPVYHPSLADFETGEVTLTLRVLSNGSIKTDDMQLRLYKALSVFAGADYYSGINRPLVLSQAEAYHYDSLRWHSMGDGVFEDPQLLNAIYLPGDADKSQGVVQLVLEAWSFCGYASDTVRFDLFTDYSLEGRTWSGGNLRPNTQVVAASLNNAYDFVSGFYRTVSDEEGAFWFEALLPDTYILYAFPDTLDLHEGGSYYLGDLQWNEANLIVVDGDVYDVDMSLPPVVEGFNNGEGRISGTFDLPETTFKARDFYCQPWLRDESEVNYCNGGLSNVGILLLNATKQRILGFALTDPSGKFRFKDLPWGTYQVMADLPRYGHGLCEEITLSPEQPTVSDLHLFINEEGKVRMKYNHGATEAKELSTYPNPATDEITIGGLDGNTTYNISITNAFGATVLPDREGCSNLLGEVSVSVGSFGSGVYFIRLENARECVTTKFVVK